MTVSALRFFVTNVAAMFFVSGQVFLLCKLFIASVAFVLTLIQLDAFRLRLLWVIHVSRSTSRRLIPLQQRLYLLYMVNTLIVGYKKHLQKIYSFYKNISFLYTAMSVHFIHQTLFISIIGITR